MEKSLWYQLRNSFIPSCLRSEEFGDCLERAPFLTNSQGRVTFPRDGHLAGGSGRSFLVMWKLTSLEGLLCARHCPEHAAWATSLRLPSHPTGRPIAIHSLQMRKQRLREVTVLFKASWVVEGGARL